MLCCVTVQGGLNVVLCDCVVVIAELSLPWHVSVKHVLL